MDADDARGALHVLCSTCVGELARAGVRSLRLGAVTLVPAAESWLAFCCNCGAASAVAGTFVPPGTAPCHNQHPPVTDEELP